MELSLSIIECQIVKKVALMDIFITSLHLLHAKIFLYTPAE